MRPFQTGPCSEFARGCVIGIMYTRTPVAAKGPDRAGVVRSNDWITSYRPAIIAFFRRRLEDGSEAEDAAQEVLARLSQRGELTHKNNVGGYVFQAAANHLRDRKRRARVRPLIELEGGADPSGRLKYEITPEQDLIGRQRLATAKAALAELPERQRTIFLLSRYEQMSAREIAQALGISQRAVEKNISRALAHLRERLS